MRLANGRRKCSVEFGAIWTRDTLNINNIITCSGSITAGHIYSSSKKAATSVSTGGANSPFHTATALELFMK